jgi:hypothetical protein
LRSHAPYNFFWIGNTIDHLYVCSNVVTLLILRGLKGIVFSSSAQPTKREVIVASPIAQE